jgi:nitroreductase
MTTLNASHLLERLNWRYAVKRFDAQKKISAADWQGLEEALILSPSSFGLQPWKFVVVANPDVRKKLLPLSWNQTQTVDASHFVVFAIKRDLGVADIERFIQRTATVRGIPAETIDGYKKMMIGDLVHGPRSKIINEWATRQVYIALGNFMTSAAMIGVDTCPMEGIDPPKYDEVLGLPAKGFQTVVACAAGYRADDDKYAKAAKVRYPRDDMIWTI